MTVGIVADKLSELIVVAEEALGAPLKEIEEALKIRFTPRISDFNLEEPHAELKLCILPGSPLESHIPASWMCCRNDDLNSAMVVWVQDADRKLLSCTFLSKLVNLAGRDQCVLTHQTNHAKGKYVFFKWAGVEGICLTYAPYTLQQIVNKEDLS